VEQFASNLADYQYPWLSGREAFNRCEGNVLDNDGLGGTGGNEDIPQLRRTPKRYAKYSTLV
jgi:hypothetical protein